MATHTPGHLRPGGGQERRPAPQTRTARESPACYQEGDSDKAEGSAEAPNQLLKNSGHVCSLNCGHGPDKTSASDIVKSRPLGHDPFRLIGI